LGLYHAVALKSDGSLWAWGWYRPGLVGLGDSTYYCGTPTRVGTETNWINICAGAGHTLGLKNDGSIWAWGDNSRGQLGDGTTNNRSVPTMIGADRDWQAIAVGSMNSFALKSNGTIWGWGFTPLFGRDLAPNQIEPGTNWLAISAYDCTVLALKTDGTLWLRSGFIGNASVMAAASVSGPTTNFTQLGRDGDWTEVYAGQDSLFARKKDGSWWVCGQNISGQLSFGTKIPALPCPQRQPFSFEPWAFATGSWATLLLGKDGKLWTWGERLGAGQPSELRRELEPVLGPVVRRLPALSFLIRSHIDWTPHLLWELPPEVRRSLGTGPTSATNSVPGVN
jgi:alpha-tubulin suppressor-like RCC1 family protein